MGAFWKTLLTALLIFYAFSMIIKLIFRRKMKKLQKQMEQFTQDETAPQPEGTKNPHVDPNIGEYTDFEEVNTENN